MEPGDKAIILFSTTKEAEKHGLAVRLCALHVYLIQFP